MTDIGDSPVSINAAVAFDPCLGTVWIQGFFNTNGDWSIGGLALNASLFNGTRLSQSNQTSVVETTVVLM